MNKGSNHSGPYWFFDPSLPIDFLTKGHILSAQAIDSPISAYFIFILTRPIFF
jgi:hypothetical protein